MLFRFNKYIIILLFYFSFLFPQSENIDKEIKKGIDYIYNIKFDSAEVLFKKLIAKYPDNPSGRFFLAMIEWWKIALDFNDESRDTHFIEMLEDVIYHCDKKLKQNPKDFNALFFKGGALGFRARVRAIRESWLKAAEDGRLALPLVSLAHKIDPKNYDVYFGLGIYHYYADVVPERVPILKPLMIFFPPGNKELAFKELEDAATKGKFASTETKFFLMMILYDVEADFYKAQTYVDDLLAKYPDNPTFHKFKGRIYIKLGDYQNAANVYHDIIKKADAGYYGYNKLIKRESYYYIGLYQRYFGMLDSSLTSFKTSLDISKEIDTPGNESGFQASAALNLAIVYDILKKRDKALEYYNYVLNIKDFNSSHSQAKKYIDRP